MAIIGCNLSRQSVIVSDSQRLQSITKMSDSEFSRCISTVQFKPIKIKVLKELFSCSVIQHCCVSQSIAVSQGKCHGVPLAELVSRSQTLGVTIPVFRSMNPVLESSRQLCSFLQTSLSKSKSFQRSLLPPLLVTLVVHLFSSNEKSNCAILSTLVWTIGQGRVWSYE